MQEPYQVSSVLVTDEPRVTIRNLRCQTMVLCTGDMHGCVASWAGTLHTHTMPPFAASRDPLAQCTALEEETPYQ